MTTLLALYRRPAGGPDAEATFERRYADEHLPLVAPGLATLLVLEDVPELTAAASQPVDTVESAVEDRP